jgi:two-component system chemotaxis sensor kinase CheA
VSDREFRAEASEIVESLARGISALDSALKTGKVNPALINDVFRAAHSLKGVAGLFGVELLANLAHALEDVLGALRLGKLTMTGPALSALEESVEVFADLVREPGQPSPQSLDRVAAATARMQDIRQGGTGEAGPRSIKDLDLAPELFSVLTEYEEHRLTDNATRGVPLFLVHAPMSLEGFDVALGKLSELLKGVGEVISTLPSSEAGVGGISFDLLLASEQTEEQLRGAVAGLGPYRVQRIGNRRGAVVAPPVPEPARKVEEEPAAPQPASVAETVRVDIEKLDRLMNVVGEMTVAKNAISRLADTLRSDMQRSTMALEISKLVGVLERKIDELQNGIMEVRMVPLAQAFDRLGRMARKISRELGKEVEFVVRGEETELDKLLMEQLTDPLVHLVRNAVDHGIEAAEVREKAGKPRSGRLTVTAAPRGHHVLIVVEDDGQGLDEVNIRRIALERGIIPEERVGTLSRRELWNLIFLPGFSTRRETTDLSGRGVGLDVVKTNIARLSGMIEIDSTLGRGTRFALTVPITLAVIQSLIIRVRGRTFTLPLSSVMEVLSYEESLVRTVEGHQVFETRRGAVPLIRLGDLFAMPGEDNPRGYVALVGVATNRVGIVVDELVGQQDIVIKPLGKLLKGLRGIAGATELGEQATVLVLDVGGLVEEALGLSAAA